MNEMEDHPEVLRLEGAVQHYHWGGRDFIPRLLGIPNPQRRPFAELWIGTHPQAPSMASIAGASRPLDQVIAEAPEACLGRAACAQFGEKLPFLFKVLDVDMMLSIQVHPNRAQAQEGFARENAAGISLAAANRNYKDHNHKPEVGVALTDFWMLHGFRPLEQIAAILAGVPELSPIMPDFAERLVQARQDPGGGQRLLRELYSRIMTMPQQHVDDLLNPLLARIERGNHFDKDRPEYWAALAARDFPLPDGHRDRGIFSIYLLNLVHLRPGQGTFQPAGLLHAYLEGVTIELMANSDNVLRGGLTPKHIDVPELLKILSCESGAPEVFVGAPAGGAEHVYRTPAEEFELSRITLAPGREYSGEAANGPELFLILQGSAALATAASLMSLERGSILLIPYGKHYRLKAAPSSSVIAFKAALPSHGPPGRE
jgi:mannose-6-phosphate isomerase